MRQQILKYLIANRRTHHVGCKHAKRLLDVACRSRFRNPPSYLTRWMTLRGMQQVNDSTMSQTFASSLNTTTPRSSNSYKGAREYPCFIPHISTEALRQPNLKQNTSYQNNRVGANFSVLCVNDYMVKVKRGILENTWNCRGIWGVMFFLVIRFFSSVACGTCTHRKRRTIDRSFVAHGEGDLVFAADRCKKLDYS